MSKGPKPRSAKPRFHHENTGTESCFQSPERRVWGLFTQGQWDVALLGQPFLIWGRMCFQLLLRLFQPTDQGTARSTTPGHSTENWRRKWRNLRYFQEEERRWKQWFRFTFIFSFPPFPPCSSSLKWVGYHHWSCWSFKNTRNGQKSSGLKGLMLTVQELWELVQKARASFCVPYGGQHLHRA